MFVPPPTEVPDAVKLAAEMLNRSNLMLIELQRAQRESFLLFWRNNRALRPKEEINAILEAMDAASPGQSARFFAAAKELVELILSMAPDSLGLDDWMPPYDYAVDMNTGALRVT